MESGKKQGLVGVSLKDCWRSCSLCCSNLLPRWTYAVQPPKKQTVCGRLFINHIKRSFSKPSLSAAECTTSLLVYGPKGSSESPPGTKTSCRLWVRLQQAGLEESEVSKWPFFKMWCESWVYSTFNFLTSSAAISSLTHPSPATISYLFLRGLLWKNWAFGDSSVTSKRNLVLLYLL